MYQCTDTSIQPSSGEANHGNIAADRGGNSHSQPQRRCPGWGLRVGGDGAERTTDRKVLIPLRSRAHRIEQFTGRGLSAQNAVPPGGGRRTWMALVTAVHHTVRAAV